MTMRVVIALNSAWNLVNFRAGLVRALVNAGYEVMAIAPPDKYASHLSGLGCRFMSLPMDTQGTHPGRDLVLLWRFYQLLRFERPVVMLGYTIKPNIYGSIAAHALGIPVVNNISGLGATFIKRNWVTRVVHSLYRIALRKSYRVFFQNDDDRQLFMENGLVSADTTALLPGSGIDLTKYTPAPMPTRESGRLRFLLIARMLWDKGVGEYVEAARIVKQRHPEAEFCLLGFLDVQNPAAISRADMEEWVAGGVVNYLGVSNDVREQIAEADCIVLPSYREGTPRTLLEAAAVSRPLIATDVPGCREVVEDKVNGLLCKVRDVEDLADKMEQMIALSPEARVEMGRRGREKIERQFDERFVIDAYLNAIREIEASGRQG